MKRPAFLALALAACAPAAEAPPAPPEATTATGADWPAYNGTVGGARYSGLTEITAANVAGLQPACTFDTGEQAGFSNGPIVVAGTIYISTDTATYAVDGATCERKWRTGRPYPPPLSFLAGNRGLAWSDGRLFRGAGDGAVYALDAASGVIVWEVKVADHLKGESTPAAPVAWGGLVFTGVAGGDNYGVRGRVVALDAATGDVRWTFTSIPDTGHARTTWPADTSGHALTGGAFWTSFTVDTLGGVLFAPAGNPAPDFAPEMRPGENLFANSIVALDARTGRLLGYVQVIPGDFHDWDVSATPALVTTRGGTRLLATPAKDGHLHGIELTADTVTGPVGSLPLRLGVRYRVVTTTRENVDAPLSHDAETRFCPGTQGGSEWNGAAFHPGLNLLYVGTVDWCSLVKLARVDTLEGKVGGAWTASQDGGFGRMDPKEAWKGWVTAADADSGTIRWKHQTKAPVLGAVTATAGGVVLSADAMGNAFALDAATGQVLWQHDLGVGMIGGVVTYEAGRKQRVAFAAGARSPIWPLPPGSSRVLVFSLP
jgi:alcohol dehydrogenase (cytochrome c)